MENSETLCLTNPNAVPVVPPASWSSLLSTSPSSSPNSPGGGGESLNWRSLWTSFLSSPNSPAGGESCKWRELPRDVMVTILMKLTPLEVLKSTQFVCKSWHEACKDPAAWRTIDFVCDPSMQFAYEKMALNAVDRSCGGLLEICIEDFCSDELLLHIAQRSSCLRCLQLRCCYDISNDALLEAMKNLPLLEEVELTLCPVTSLLISSIGKNCPNLVSLKLNQTGSRDPSLAEDEHALAIAETMPLLHHLQLIGSMMTNEGLQAILDSCSCLESLDLRACFQVHLSGSMGKRCADKVKDVKWPHDSTSDYKFITMDYDSDYGDYLDELDIEDFMSVDEYYELSDDSELPDYEDLFI